MQINEKEVKVLDKEISPVVKKATSIEIRNPSDMKKATEMLSQINKYADEVEEKKKSVTDPLNAALKAARGLFKPLEEKLEEAIGSIRSSMTSYQTEQRRLEKIEEDKIASRVGEGKGKLKVETAVKKIDEIKKADQNVSAESGSVKFKTVKKFEVMDVTMLPHDYILANETLIRKAMNEGNELPGVRYYTEEVPFNSR